MTGGRTPKLTPEVGEIILEAVGKGSPWCVAAQAAGVHPSTLRRWKKLGREGDETYSAFCVALKRAEAQNLQHHIEIIRKAAEHSWQAAAWMLERRLPEEFASARDLLRDIIREAKEARREPAARREATRKAKGHAA